MDLNKIAQNLYTAGYDYLNHAGVKGLKTWKNLRTQEKQELARNLELLADLVKNVFNKLDETPDLSEPTTVYPNNISCTGDLMDTFKVIETNENNMLRFYTEIASLANVLFIENDQHGEFILVMINAFKRYAIKEGDTVVWRIRNGKMISLEIEDQSTFNHMYRFTPNA